MFFIFSQELLFTSSYNWGVADTGVLASPTTSESDENSYMKGSWRADLFTIVKSFCNQITGVFAFGVDLTVLYAFGLPI